MNNDDWSRTIHSAAHDEFVIPMFPRKGEQVTIRLRIARENPVREVYLRTILDGLSRRIQMDREPDPGRFDWFSATITAEEARIQYSFECLTADDCLFYTRSGVYGVHQTEDHDFVILTDLEPLSWIPGAVFYQIFPDRFRRGVSSGETRSSHGVKDGEYRFDGHETKALNWGETPPEYETGHCLDFFNGDLDGIREAIPYLKRLGVTALYLNPIFSAYTNHRYDCIDYFHVDPHLGGDAALVRLVEALHHAGIRCIVDVSINHTGIGHRWFQKAQKGSLPEAEFYYRRPDGSFLFWFDVPTLPQLNYGSDTLREMIWRGEDSMVRRFLRPPFTIDGWRFDVANQVGRAGEDQFCHEIWREVRTVVKRENPDAYIIGEHWEDHIDYVLGDQWDGAMNYFGSGRLIRRWLGEKDRFLRNDWGHSPERGRPITGQEFAQSLRSHLSRIPGQLVLREFNLFDSHDTPRLHSHEAIYDWDLLRGAIILLYMLPGPVSIYYGDEIALEGHDASVEGSRYAMDWHEDRQKSDVFTLYADLSALRASRKELAWGSWDCLVAEDDLLVFGRHYRGGATIAVIYKGEESRQVRIPANLYGIDTVEAFWRSSAPTLSSDDQGNQTIVITVEPRKSQLLLCTCAER